MIYLVGTYLKLTVKLKRMMFDCTVFEITQYVALEFFNFGIFHQFLSN